MTTKIRKEDLVDADVIDSVELLSTGSTAYRTGVTVVSTTASNKQVVISGISLTDPDLPVDVADIVVLTGNAAAGTYTVNSIISSTIFDVVESIVDSTGGLAAFKFPPGAKAVGYDSTNIDLTATTVQSAIYQSRLNSLLADEPSHTGITYTPTYSGNNITNETWVKTVGSTNIKTVDYTYTSGKITQEVRKIYADNGTTITAQLTVTYSYTGNQLTSAVEARDI